MAHKTTPLEPLAPEVLAALQAHDEAHAGEDPIIEIKDLQMVFNIANEQLTNLKEYFIKILKHELFYREFVALKNVSLNIYPGERYGLVGVNGSGKSTLLKCIAGVLTPTQGTVKSYGTMAPLIELGAGFDIELTARENTYLNGALLGYSKEFIEESFDSIIDFAEVQDFVDMPLKNYSSGMVARIAFSIATATTPDILVVDEALSVGDFMFRQKCEDRISELVDGHGTTLLFVSHSPEQVRRVCNRAVWIDKGTMRMEGEVDAVMDAYESMAEEK
ncbi:MAG: ABC transporter ATP-binding protein [Eggerthellaceae bacterium]|nr:ABC transporter ATP-binding protein [Eggerthellaceae bacterium]